MDKKDIEIVDALFLKETAYEVILSHIDTFIFPNKPSNPYEDFKQSLVRTTYKESIDIVFKYAESPIEKIFLNALLLQNLLYGPYLIKYTEPLCPAYQIIHNLRVNYELVMQLWQNFQDANGKDEDGIKFTAFILDSPELTNEDKDLIMHHLFYEYGLKHINVLHLSLQCCFEDITVNGKLIRPDIFIWIPSKPDFKLIVECDGFQFHSDKYAFTNDRERDRAFRDRGFQVFRFSGQEIVNAPVYKARELLDYLIKVQQELFRDEIMDDYHRSQQANS